MPQGISAKFILVLADRAWQCLALVTSRSGMGHRSDAVPQSVWGGRIRVQSPGKCANKRLAVVRAQAGRELQGSSTVPVGWGNRGGCPITETGQQGGACRRNGLGDSARWPWPGTRLHPSAVGRMALYGDWDAGCTGQGESCSRVWGFRKAVRSGPVTREAFRACQPLLLGPHACCLSRCWE